MKNAIEIKNGFLLFMALGVYFLLMNALGFANNAILRNFNALLILYFINRTITYKIENGTLDFFDAFFAALKTGALGVLLSMIGLVVFVQFNGGEMFLKELSGSLFFGRDLGVIPYAAALFFEGIASVLIGVFLLMQYRGKQLYNPKLE